MSGQDFKILKVKPEQEKTSSLVPKRQEEEPAMDGPQPCSITITRHGERDDRRAGRGPPVAQWRADDGRERDKAVEVSTQLRPASLFAHLALGLALRGGTMQLPHLAAPPDAVVEASMPLASRGRFGGMDKGI